MMARSLAQSIILKKRISISLDGKDSEEHMKGRSRLILGPVVFKGHINHSSAKISRLSNREMSRGEVQA